MTENHAEGRADADGSAHSGPPGQAEGSRAAFGCTGAILLVGVVLGAFLSTLAFGLSSMCSDDFDTSDCGSAQAMALLPLAPLLGAVLWGVGWSRRDRPDGQGWAWTGAAFVLVPLLFVAQLASG